MLVKGDAGRVTGSAAGACSIGTGFGARAHVGIARAHHGVIDVVLGDDSGRAAGLDDAGVTLVARSNIGDTAQRDAFLFSGAGRQAAKMKIKEADSFEL